MHKIMVNCGHGRTSEGAWDPGTVWGKYNEAELMLPITKAAVKYLRANGVTVLSDADTDNNKNITADIALANKEKVEIYVSVHCDYFKADSGVMPLYVSEQGKKLAEALDEAISKGIPMESKGVQKKTDLRELNETDMPAVILETGSIDDDTEIFLKKYDLYGKCIAEGVCNYLGIKQEEKSVTYGEIRKYRCKQVCYGYNKPGIASGRTGTETNPGSVYSAVDWSGDFVKIPYLGNDWFPVKGSGGVYLERIQRIRYVVTNATGVNVYADHRNKSKRLETVEPGAFLTVTKWFGKWGYVPAVKGWVAMSCLSEETAGTRIYRDCAINAKKLVAANVHYSADCPPTTLAGAIKEKKTDCAHYASFAYQDEGILPVGQYVWLNKHINGNGADDIIKSDRVKIYYNVGKTAKEIRVPFGAMVGYGYTYKTKSGKVKSGQHTQIGAGYTSAGNPLWWSGGVTDVNGKSYGPKRKTTYEDRPIDVMIVPL